MVTYLATSSDAITFVSTVNYDLDRCPCCGDTDLQHSHELSAAFILTQDRKIKDLEERIRKHDDKETY